MEQLSIFDIAPPANEAYPVGTIVKVREEAIQEAIAADDICAIHYLKELRGKEGLIVNAFVDRAGNQCYDVKYKKRLHDALLTHREVQSIN